MKYIKKAGIYKASNVTFNPETLEAFSYNWWAFVKKIKGKIIFNDFRYSNSTCKHQYKVRSLMRELGITIDRFVNVRGGLQSIETLKELNAAENETLDEITALNEEKRVRRNLRAKQRRQALKEACALSVNETKGAEHVRA